MKLHRILWIANLVLLAILGYAIAGFILGNDSGQELPVNSKPETKEKEINLDKNLSHTGNHRIILERNIFGSAGVGAGKEDPQKGKLVAPAPVVREPLQLRLLGTVAGDEDVACAVVENLKTKVQDLYKTGDIIQGARIERIERNKIILLHRDQREVLNLYVASGDSTPIEKRAETSVAQKPSVAEVVSIISPTERKINKKAFLARIGGMEAVLKTVKLSPYVVNGKAKGLRITGLEGLSMARYVGFENGDVIQVINGQEVTDRRKAFQVLRKARSLSSLDTQLLRGKDRKTLSFRIE